MQGNQLTDQAEAAGEPIPADADSRIRELVATNSALNRQREARERDLIRLARENEELRGNRDEHREERLQRQVSELQGRLASIDDERSALVKQKLAATEEAEKAIRERSECDGKVFQLSEDLK